MNSVLPLLAFSFALERSVGELCLTSQDKAAARPVTHINVTSLQNAQKCKTAMPRLFSEKFVVILPKQLFINPAALCSLQMEKRLFVVLKGKQKLERKHNLIFMLSLHSSLSPFIPLFFARWGSAAVGNYWRTYSLCNPRHAQICLVHPTKALI